jgi:phosphoribosylformylglycinamidine synthase
MTLKEKVFKFKVEVILKKGVLDPQGEAIKQSININSLGNILDVKQGKLFELTASSKNREQAVEEVEKICADLLTNSVIEEFKFYEVSES